MTTRVHVFKRYNIQKDQYEFSRRLATPEAIERISCELDMSEAYDIEDHEFDPDIPGMTKPGFWLLESVREQRRKTA
jgi:hypothetical protein